jgi:hypothetical protein
MHISTSPVSFFWNRIDQVRRVSTNHRVFSVYIGDGSKKAQIIESTSKVASALESNDSHLWASDSVKSSFLTDGAVNKIRIFFVNDWLAAAFTRDQATRHLRFKSADSSFYQSIESTIPGPTPWRQCIKWANSTTQ